jgi:hypothetical protein
MDERQLSDQPVLMQVFQNGEGDACCEECLQLGSKQRFVAKVCNFVWSMDMARLLHFCMFDPDGLQEFQSKLRASVNYVRRHKALYEKYMSLSIEELHLKVRRTWTGRLGGPQTESLQLFMAMYVTPCLDCEPGASVKKKHLNTLLSNMKSDPGTAVGDLEIVKVIVTGQVSRHPAVHGVLCAIMDKLRQWERGTHTMRNRHRTLSMLVCVFQGVLFSGCRVS